MTNKDEEKYLNSISQHDFDLSFLKIEEISISNETLIDPQELIINFKLNANINDLCLNSV